MGNFSPKEVERLYSEHTKETGQIFTAEALAKVWELSYGQPWLVNALAYEVCFKMKKGRKRSRPIDLELILEAKENLILRRETHLDQLINKLQEARVRRVIGPMLQGLSMEGQAKQDDIQYLLDLGLIRRSQAGLVISNGIYQEVIPRELAYVTQLNFESLIQQSWYITKEGRLDLAKLLTEFQAFFREYSEH